MNHKSLQDLTEVPLVSDTDGLKKVGKEQHFFSPLHIIYFPLIQFNLLTHSTSFSYSIYFSCSIAITFSRGILLNTGSETDIIKHLITFEKISEISDALGIMMSAQSGNS